MPRKTLKVGKSSQDAVALVFYAYDAEDSKGAPPITGCAPFFTFRAMVVSAVCWW